MECNTCPLCHVEDNRKLFIVILVRKYSLSSSFHLISFSFSSSTHKMVIIGDVLVTKIIEKVIDVGFNNLADQYATQTGMNYELQRLNNALPCI